MLKINFAIILPHLLLLNTHLLKSYFHYILHSENEHGVHSPFVFRLLTDGIYVKTKPEIFDRIEKIRGALTNDQRLINVTDLGAGSSFDGKARARSVSQTIRWFAKSPKTGRALHRLVNFLRPPVMVELGTSLGISAMYQASGNPGGILHTIEGCPETAAIATGQFKKEGFSNIVSYVGSFEKMLPQLLQQLKQIDYVFIDGHHTYEATIRYFHLLKNYRSEGSVFVFDDIYWSKQMTRAWNDIKIDPDVTVTLDFFDFGVVFFNRELSKQCFVLRY